MIHIHQDVENLCFFTDKNGVSAYNNRVIAYAMQDENIVGIFYTHQQMKDFYETYKLKQNIPPIYFWNEEIWNKHIKK